MCYDMLIKILCLEQGGDTLYCTTGQISSWSQNLREHWKKCVVSNEENLGYFKWTNYVI